MAGLVTGLTRVLNRLAVVPFLLLAARYHRYRSDFAAAKDRLSRAAMLAPTCFTAHLRLGALYLEENDFSRARREFLTAREINPGKFRRLYPLITGRSGDININLFYFPGYSDRDSGPAPADFLREFIGEPLVDEAEEGVRWGDFSSYREYRKFQEMGPFRPEEVASVDWDAFGAELDEEE